MKRSLAVAFCLAVTPNVGGAVAQPSQPLDILGVRLGMPREAAVHLLQSRKPPYAVTNTIAPIIEDLGPSVWHTSLNISRPDVADAVDLDFAPPPTASTVLRIYRRVCYNCGVDHKTSPEAPSLDIFTRSLAEKLNSTTPTTIVGRSQFAGTTIGETAVYVWTRAGEFMSSAELRRRLRYPARCINPPNLDQARTNAGVTFNLQFDDKNFEDICGIVANIHWQQEGGVVTQFEMTFSDVAGLVSSFAKSDALVRARQEGQHQRDLQRASQNRPNL